MAEPSTRGRLLVASPVLLDPHFRRRVVLMLEHSPEGALGLVLNDPTELISVEALPAPLSDVFDPVDVLYRGGPVEESAVIVLVEVSGPDDVLGTPVCDGVAILDPAAEPDHVAAAVDRARAFGGYAGWAAGQLEREIADGAWLDAAPVADDVFGERAATLWSEVLDRKGGHFRLIARMPEDPSVN